MSGLNVFDWSANLEGFKSADARNFNSVIDALTQKSCTLGQLHEQTNLSKDEIIVQLQKLVRQKQLAKRGSKFVLVL